jgi:hypothetical protein
MGHRPEFWDELGQELQPLVNHACCALFLEISLVVGGLVVLSLEHLFPHYEHYFSLIKIIEVWTALAILCMFGFYTIVLIGIRIYQSLRKEYLKQP